MDIDTLIEKVRDEIGSGEPSDDALATLLEDSDGSWRAVALRVLKRRRADIAGAAGKVSQVSLSGVLSVAFTGGDLRSLDNQIARLEVDLAAEGQPDGAGARFITRPGVRG